LTKDSSVPASDETQDRDDGLAKRLSYDAEAFAQFYDLYCDRIYRYVLSRVGNTEDAADLTQQIFLKAFRARGQYRSDRGSAASWIFTIARSQANSFQSRRRTDSTLSDVPESLMPASQGPGETSIQIDDVDRLRACVNLLGSQDQELIRLRFGADLKVPEIAIVVNRKPEAAKKQLQRALKRLKEMYDDDFK
jgi:RNA polymerase sigma-70 factor (ECF subfamily)